MKYSKQLSIELPADDDGMIGRECPRCQGRFTVHMERFERGGYLNLRCPYCQFIAEADTFLTGEQRAHVYSIQRDELLTMTEDMMADIMEEVFSGTDFEVTGGDADFGNVPIESPEFSTETDDIACTECGFQYGVADGRDGVCPVCR